MIAGTTSTLTAADRWDHFLARIGVNRQGHRVDPGLYAIGSPSGDSPVLVTANYTLSFDALRSVLSGISAYILVLDTKGINVWCAAGKGTFGTDELVERISATRLDEVVSHRRLILPQLGAPGVAAHAVKERSGFAVVYGPVRAEDLPAYLATGKASPEMRRVRFALRDRMVLVPVEIVHVLYLFAVFLAVKLIFGRALGLEAFAGMAAVLAGVVLFPMLLPWIPTRDFSSKGFVFGAVCMIPFVALRLFINNAELSLMWRVAAALALALKWPAVTAFLALNFTGATTFTSRTGVRKEMYRYLRGMAVCLAAGLVLNVLVIVVS